MMRLGIRVGAARWVAAGLFLASGLAGLLVFLPFERPVERPVILALAGASAAVAGALALLPPSVRLLRVLSPVSTLAIGVTAAASGGAQSGALELLVLPLIFAAALYDRRRLLPTVAAYLSVRVVMVSRASDLEDTVQMVLAATVELSVAALVTLIADRADGALRLDRLRARLAMARHSDEIEDALAEELLDGDIVAAALAIVDGPAPAMAEVVADVGRGAGTRGVTFRVSPADSFSIAARRGPRQCLPDPHSDDEGERLAHARGHGSAAVIPLRSAGVLVGHVVLSSSRRNAFPPRRLARLAAHYRPIGESLGSYLVRRERDARLRAALVGSTLTRELAVATDVRSLLDAAARRVSELLGTTTTIVFAPDPSEPEVLQAVAAHGQPHAARIDTRTQPSGARTAMERREPLVIADARRPSVAGGPPADAPPAESLLFVPVLDGDGARAGLSCSWRAPRLLRPDEIDLVTLVAAEVSAAWSRLEVEERLRRQANHDPLTGLLNHRAFHDEVSRALAGLGRVPGPVALVLADLDHLKHTNDYHGHSVGDAALRRIALVLRSAARTGDVIGRLGGDEFGWLLVGADAGDALTAAHRAVALAAAAEVEPVGGLSLSAGVAVTAEALEPERLFELADHGLYAAKAQGRGVAVLAHGGSPEGGSEPDDAVAVASVTASAPELLDIGEATVREWAEAFRCHFCLLSVLDDEGRAVRAIAGHWGTTRAWSGDAPSFALEDYPSTRRAIEQRTTYTCRIDDPEADPAEVALLHRDQLASLLLVPLIGETGPVGIIELYDGRPRRFTADERRLGLVLGRHTAALLERQLA